MLRDQYDRYQIRGLLKEWKYPREIATDELDHGLWYCLVDLFDGEPRPSVRQLGGVTVALLWFVDVPAEYAFCAVAAHVCASPDLRGHLFTRRNFDRLELQAEVIGAHRVYSLLPEGGEEQGIPVKAMRRLLRIWGWESDWIGMYHDLGEVV